MSGRFQFGWVISVLEKDKQQGLVIELADLGNGKHMIVATDTAQSIATDVFRQAGFGPFVLDENVTIADKITTLKEHLLSKRV